MDIYELLYSIPPFAMNEFWLDRGMEHQLMQYYGHIDLGSRLEG